ncbi:MAG: hypothetical protein ABFD10_20405 [Prolixibacteraceae bacterium]
MKNKLKIGLAVLGVALFVFNLSFNVTPKTDSNVNLALMGSKATADSECVKSPGDPIYGTPCTVKYVTPGDYYFWFVQCWEFCDPGGTNCCYVLNF